MMRKKAQIEAEHQKVQAEAAWREAEVEDSLYVLQKSATAASAEAAVYKAAAEMEEELFRDLHTHFAPTHTVQRTVTAVLR